MKAVELIQKWFPQINRVEDATQSLDIEVTEADIATSEQQNGRRNHRACVFACAAKKSDGIDGVLISISKAYLIKGSLAMRYRTNEAMSREIVSFDRGGSFAAGTYHLMQPCNPLGYAHRNKTKGARGKKRKAGLRIRRVAHRTPGLRDDLQSAPTPIENA